MSYASLRFVLDEQGAPYYQQLVAHIQQSIVSGEWGIGDKLPSSRFLASSLGVSRSTTTRAYDQLIAEGVLTSEEKRGVFVAALPMMTPRTPSPVRLATPMEGPEQVQRFDSGADASVFPTKEWAASMRRSWLTPDFAVLQGGYATGYPALKAAIVEYLYRVRGLECCAEQIIVTAGSRDSLLLLKHTLSALSKTSPKWWLESPTYPPIRECFRADNASGELTIDDEGPCLPTSTTGSNVAILTPNRQYPLGISMSPQRRQKWLMNLENNLSEWWLVEDDYDNEFVYHGRNNVPFMQTASVHPNAKNRLFFIGSFSKVLFRGLRLGFIVAPLAHLDAMRNSQRKLGSSASLPIQPAVADFMQQGHFERHVNRMRRHYRIKRDALLSLLDEFLSHWFYWKKPQGGMHILVEFKANFTKQNASNKPLDQIIAGQLTQANIVLSTLSEHYDKNATCFHREGFLLGFSGPSLEQIEDLVGAIASCCQENIETS
ncbi:PLP-dependent aminotransferase family protein [Marinomonas sp. A79]|uniref:PLP-dependent aminotransferase family protein n=1 Tax=Marinomonas vulgaris TaxID=2823372 RepID=A0ABS5H924_9GAMM|nr:PLP-dependent aminotransferase family protein [Marinomonas vulgaris]MBR7888186.1 PLP-dependent aminotransferase family protein [Marinomonas vulgaris]